MLSWVIQITVISIILIFLVHHLINFFKSTLTVPKIKDLVNTSTQKYESMYNIIQQKSNTYTPNSSSNTKNDYTLIDLLPKQEEPNMKNELKNFLKKQLQNDGTDVYGVNTMSNISSYSNY
jgi:hypothetical protein